MIERTINKVLKSISNLPAEYKIALIRILTGIVENIIALDKGKVDKEEGKGLSTNDFTNELKNKLNNIENGAQKNVKSDWNAITGDSIILNKPSLNVYPDSAIWDEQNKNIIFKHQGTILPQMTISGANFIKDGMVDNVQIQDNNLVITFNTDAGKSPFSIPLINIFNPNNYYNKTQTDNKFVEKVAGKQLSTEDFTTDLKTRLENIGDANLMTSITYNELKTLRDNNQLSPGMQYRITDYQCTTISSDTIIRSANHQFDIIVIADDVNKLNENTRACLHEGDTYFANSKLEDWELKYCLDNDTTKFNWANTTNGKGVIYWMKDEWNNECPYDFKNIQFSKSNVWLYTFNTNDSNDQTNKLDDSVYTTNCRNNIIESYFENTYKLNRNIFGNSCYNNILKSGCHDNTFGNTCFNNFLDNTCYYNTFGDECRWNHFGVNCTNNTLGINCTKITFSQACYQNTINNRVENVIFEQYCNYNTLGVSNQSVKLGFACAHNVFDNYCYRNTLGVYCENNQFGSSSSNNVLGPCSSRNTLGTNCSYNCIIDDSYNNTFGNYCTRNILITSSNNSFGNNCTDNKFINSDNNSFLTFDSKNIFENCSYNTVKDYFMNNIFNYCKYINVQKIGVIDIIVESGNTYIDITSTQTTSSTNKLQNFKIAQGVNNTATVKTISHNTINDTFQTIYKPVNSVEIEV